jgi:hypothetical protein
LARGFDTNTFSQSIFAVKAIRRASVTTAPIVMVIPVRPLKKKL